MSEQWILAALCLVTRWLNSFSVTILLLLFAFCFTLLFSHFFSSCFSFLFFLSWFLFIIPVLHFFFFLSSLCIYFASFYPQLSQTPGRCASRRLFHSQLRKKRQMQSLYQLFSLVSQLVKDCSSKQILFYFTLIQCEMTQAKGPLYLPLRNIISYCIQLAFKYSHSLV